MFEILKVDFVFKQNEKIWRLKIPENVQKVIYILK